ncbi:MAG TPA: PilZ domain-containing protein [Azospira sp.]|nr:PilZ domain-containing protein [Azospira sp.]
MLNEQRNGRRYAMHGMVALVGQDQSMVGHVADISTSGIALTLHDERNGFADIRKTWLCRVVSPELPEALEFVARIVRPRTTGHGYGLACKIAEISDSNLALLESLQKKRQRVAGYH